MASVAAILGFDWSAEPEGPYTLTPHAARQTLCKGFAVALVLAAANNPEYSYPNGRFPGQRRHIRGGIVAVVDVARSVVVTVYQDRVVTALRDDQTDVDALAFAAKNAI